MRLGRTRRYYVSQFPIFQQSAKEFELLSYLAIHANTIVTHRELLQQVWGSNFGDEKEYLRVFINRLRKKIESEPDDPQYLLTEPWVGYRLRLSQ